MAVMFVRNNNHRQLGNTNENALARRNERLQSQKNSQMKNGSIFAGNLNQKEDSFIMRKKQAMKKAMKVVTDAWTSEKKIDQNVADRRQNIQDKKQLMEENNRIIQDYEQQKEELQKMYGVEADSQEQKDLELLEKRNYAMKHPGEVRLTKEEQERLAEIAEQPLTEYQQRALEVDNSILIYQSEIDVAKEEISADSAAITSIKIERLKTHTMVDATKEAEEIKEAAGKEAIGMLVGEAQEHITEEQEEKYEEAKERAEEKEKQEEKLEEVREEKEIKQEEFTLEQEQKRAQEEVRKQQQEENAKEQEEILENAAVYAEGSLIDASQVQAEIKDMLHKMKLLEEDIKGAEVDVEL
ncbi:MAG: hypothetical protein J6B68_04625 [Lachnospiraceae bacterium]|nr:hypothetical protein [Lachnospiraceae bacterium]